MNKKIEFLNRFSLLFHFVLSIAICFTVEWISRHSVTSACAFALVTPWRFLYNSALIFISLLLVYPFRIRAFLRTAISVFWLLLGIINGVILANRVTPFNFTDFKMVKDIFVLKNNYYSTVEAVLVFAALAALIFFFTVFAVKGPRFQGKPRRITSIIAVALALIFLPSATSAAVSVNLLSDYYANLAQGYEDYGFIYSFSSSIVELGMGKPENYSKETIEKITADLDVPDTGISDEELPNIICVQLESFMDPKEFTFLSTSKDACPNFHKLQKEFSTGYLTVPVVGAGTANTEFEVLTGMSIEYFGLGEYPYKTVLQTRSCESIASDLSGIGYSTHAVHNNGGNFYSRAHIFSQMGFDTFTSEELMDATEYNELDTWAKDGILTGEIEKCLDSSADTTDFVYTITVQSHGSYPETKVFDHPAITVTGLETEAKTNQWEYYVNEIYQVDEFIGDLIAMLDKREEKTIVVLFGDHLPTMGLGEDDVASKNLYNTQYVTWNNFGLPKEDQDLSTYQLLAALTDSVQIHEGTIFTYHQQAAATAKNTSESFPTLASWMSRILSPNTSGEIYKQGLELLQYDLLYGERYCYNGEDLFPATSLQMGISDVLIDHVSPAPDQDRILVYGEGFTPSSHVFINDTSVETTYISSTCLQVDFIQLQKGDTFCVCQLGSQDTVFRSSNIWYY